MTDLRTYEHLTLAALLLLVVALPLYASQETERIAQAQATARRKLLADAAALYLDQCASCHGLGGEGIGAMPALNRTALSRADQTLLYRTIALPAHGTAMASWHGTQERALTDAQVKGLITLIHETEWQWVRQLAELKPELSGSAVATTTVDLRDLEVSETETLTNPHECRSCHEEPTVHADRFGLNCARCHTLEAWKPALLNRHIFDLNHGEQGQIACQTCHMETYATYTCYGCHEHKPEQMQTVHEAEKIDEYEACASCHPTGQPGEADPYRYPGQEARTTQPLSQP
jgi:mono/diheme cytochrome c family protein